MDAACQTDWHGGLAEAAAAAQADARRRDPGTQGARDQAWPQPGQREGGWSGPEWMTEEVRRRRAVAANRAVEAAAAEAAEVDARRAELQAASSDLGSALPGEAWDEFPDHEIFAGLAASVGDVKMLRWLRSRDPPAPWTEYTASLAARHGKLEALQWMRSQRPPVPWSQRTTAFAARGGHLRVLAWLRRQDPPCPWGGPVPRFTAGACYEAAKEGRLDALKFLRSERPPCPMDDERVCAVAALGGHLEVLKFLRSEGCKWDSGTHCHFTQAHTHTCSHTC